MISLSAAERLKGATRQLLASAGGIDAVAAVLDVNRSQVSRYQTLGSPEFITVAKVAALESLDGVPPHVTRALAALAGHILVERPMVDGAGVWGQAMGAVIKEVGDVVQALGTALSDDASVSAEEAERLQLVMQVDEAMSKLAGLRAMLVGLADSENSVAQRRGGGP